MRGGGAVRLCLHSDCAPVPSVITNHTSYNRHSRHANNNKNSHATSSFIIINNNNNNNNNNNK